MADDFLEALRTQAASSLFPTEGELSVAGLAASVTIRRDAWGTPAIEAGSLEDLWFAQGLVTAGERLFQLDLAIRAATGRLAEVSGDEYPVAGSGCAAEGFAAFLHLAQLGNVDDDPAVDSVGVAADYRAAELG
jgi:hypothetical protein